MSSNLVEHAKQELALIGEEPETVEGYLNIIQAFADMGHSGGSAAIAVPVLTRLLQYKNLSPLTDDPDEWIFHNKNTHGASEDLWQNKRDFEAFSTDGGKTYFRFSENTRRWHGGVKRHYHQSVHVS
jgi:hypothetical protein